MLADRRYCYPLTITDFASRYLISCDALSATKEKYAFTVHGLEPGEHTVAVRAYDRFENVGVGKATFTVAGTKN